MKTNSSQNITFLIADCKGISGIIFKRLPGHFKPEFRMLPGIRVRNIGGKIGKDFILQIFGNKRNIFLLQLRENQSFCFNYRKFF
nr:hypothetical protein [Chryseobacterium oranimense]